MCNNKENYNEGADGMQKTLFLTYLWQVAGGEEYP
jgi:hypothetical protein